jgi:MSHA biogenesis protein MshP
MRLLTGENRQAGFALAQALFVVVVLALLGAAMLKLSGQQFQTGVFAVQGARAYQAARSGLEWGIAEALNDGNCTTTNPNFNLFDFQVSVTCVSDNYSEAGVGYKVFRINAEAVFGVYGTPDYVNRRLEAKVTSFSGP